MTTVNSADGDKPTIEPDDRYLWDRSGPPDEEVARLERLLAPLAHREDAAAPSAPPAALSIAGAPRRRVWIPFSLAAAAALVAFTLLSLDRSQSPGTSSPSTPPAPGTTGPRIADATGALLDTGAWIRTESMSKEVVLDNVGRVTVHPESHVKITHVAADVTRLYLERGRIEARIGADVRPRFFQVDTDAARCVDLGCRYTLSAEPDGSSMVSVLTGRVSFEAAAEGQETREVFVPARAQCVAKKGRGPGTPRFSDAPVALASEVDRFDAAADGSPDRREHAKAAASLARSSEDLLPVWHWLTDVDADVATLALARLREQVGDPEDWTPPAGRPSAADREAFRAPLGFAR